MAHLVNDSRAVAALVALGALVFALLFVTAAGDRQVASQEDAPIQCDTNTDARCIDQTREARTVVALTAARATEDAEIEERVRTETWREAGATLVAEREYLYGQIETANARLEGAFMPLHCWEHEVSDFLIEFEQYLREHPEYDPLDGLGGLYHEVGDECINNSIVAMHAAVSVAATATAIAALTATALAEAE